MKKLKNNIPKKNEFNRIVIPVDGSKESKRAVRKGLILAKETGVQVLAIHVVQLPYSVIPDAIFTYPDFIQTLKKRGKKILDDVSNEGKKIGVKVKTKLIEGIPENEIIKESNKNDLIVMDCKNKPPLNRFLIGSLCDKVVHHSKSPVMVIR